MNRYEKFGGKIHLGYALPTVGTVLTTEVAVNFENFFEGVLAVN